MPASAVAADAPVAPKIHKVRGVLKSIDAEGRQATIAHEAIAGYMGAMTMSFEVRDPAELRTLHPGDKLSFDLSVTDQTAWIEHLSKTDTVMAPLLAPAPRRTTRELDVGDELPDFEMTDQAGGKIRLRDLHGSAVVITFVYSRCPLPTYCPLMNRNLQTAQALLERLGGKENWHMISLSLDADHDTPQVLAEYAKNFQANARRWTFATTHEEDLNKVTAAVGLQFQRSGGQVSHNLRTVVVDAAGRIQRIFRGNGWTPQDLAAELRTASRVHP